MRRLVQVAVGGVAVIALLVFLFAPIMFWYDATAPLIVNPNSPSLPVYRSLGCAAIGFGDLYSPHWFGLSLGCQVQFPFPFTGPSNNPF